MNLARDLLSNLSVMLQRGRDGGQQPGQPRGAAGLCGPPRAPHGGWRLVPGISTLYLHYIYTIPTLYLHHIYIIYTQYLLCVPAPPGHRQHGARPGQVREFSPPPRRTQHRGADRLRLLAIVTSTTSTSSAAIFLNLSCDQPRLSEQEYGTKSDDRLTDIILESIPGENNPIRQQWPSSSSTEASPHPIQQSQYRVLPY